VGATDRLVLSCEHGGHRVPQRYAALFAGRERLLRSHRGWDPGALRFARRLARRLEAPLLATTWTRLLVDANRPPGDPELFSPLSAALPGPERARILARLHRPHWAAVESRVARELAAGHRVVHVAVHSIAPRLRGEPRRCDVGLLYDPRRFAERSFCRRWTVRMRALLPSLRVRANHPYRGDSPGLTSSLRARFGARRYLGIELELGQARLRAAGARSELFRCVEESLASLLRDGAARRPRVGGA
jgi:predicted N-formylglutamate amidohydrolase